MDKKPLKIYISGPISGYCLRERIRVFAEKAEVIRQRGYIPVNPLEGVTEDAKEDEESRKQYMRNDIKKLLKCDAIYFFGSYYMSEGCKCEMMVAKTCGLKLYDYDMDQITDWDVKLFFQYLIARDD